MDERAKYCHGKFDGKFQYFKGYWSIKDVQKHKNWLFVYGDNDIHIGNGGQAIIRDEPNTIGVPTKKLPSMSKKAFYTDAELEDNKKKINAAFRDIQSRSKYYDHVVFPEDGLGTGLAMLPTYAPQTLEHINKRIKIISKLL